MSLGVTLLRFKTERVQALPARIIRATIEQFGESLVTDWSPLGNPELWKSAPPANYRPGNFRSSWFLSIGAPSGDTTDATGEWIIHNVVRLAEFKAGQAVYLSNSAPHASSLEYGHSSQAPTGILVNAMEFEGIVYDLARRIAA